MMKRLNYSVLRMLSAFVVGLLLILFPEDAGNYFVITIGVVFIIPSLIGLGSWLAGKGSSYRRFPVEGVGSLLFGLWLVIMPSFFTTLLTYVLGFMLLMGGVQQLAFLQAARRWVPVSIYYYIVPVLILVGGMVALFNPGGVQRTAFLIIGVGCMVYALQELVSWLRLMRRRPQPEEYVQQPSAHIEQEDDDIEDVEIIEIKQEK